MSYKHFYRSIIIRLAIIILLSAAATFLYFEIQAPILSIMMFVILVGAVINIIKYFNGLNHWIASFLMGIENDDTTLKIPLKTNNKSIDEVYAGIERLNILFRQIKVDISTQEQYYRSVIDQSATGLFSIDKTGRVININPAAIKLTRLNEYHHVNALSVIDKKLPGFIMKSIPKIKRQSSIFENQTGQKLLFKL